MTAPDPAPETPRTRRKPGPKPVKGLEACAKLASIYQHAPGFRDLVRSVVEHPDAIDGPALAEAVTLAETMSADELSLALAMFDALDKGSGAKSK